MNPEMQTTLLNTYPPKLIATILRALREQLKENDHLKRLHAQDRKSLLKGGGFWDDVYGGYLPEDLVLTVRREEIEWVHSDDVHEIVPMQECKNAGKKLLELIWVDTDKSEDPTHKTIRSRPCAREYKTKKQDTIQRAFLASQLFSAMPPLEAVKALVSIMMSVSWSSTGKPLKLKHYDISRAHFQGTAQRLVYIRFASENRQKIWRRPSWQTDQGHVQNS